MRTIWTLGLLAALALPARADIVDSGGLTIGGQGVIGGTFTVQGNDLGVAGSVSATSATLSGSGAQIYSLTTSSGIHVVAGILRWPDGTVSTSAHSGGGGSGNALLSATQTWTGGNTFQSTITVGPSGYSTVADYSSVLKGGCGVVLYSSFTAASSLAITGISSEAYKHVLTFNATKATQGTIQLTVNGDSGSNYWTNNRGLNTGGTNVYKYAVAAYYDMVACYSLEAPDTNTLMTSNLTVLNAPKLHNDVLFLGNGRYNYATGDSDHDVGCTLSGHYRGTARMSSLTLTASAGTMTGWLTLDACVPMPAK